MKFKEFYKLWETSKIKKGDYVFVTNAVSLKPTDIWCGALKNIEKTDNPEKENYKTPTQGQNVVYFSNMLNFERSDGEFSVQTVSDVCEFGNATEVPTRGYIYFLCDDYKEVKGLMENRGFDEEQIQTYFEELKKLKESGD